MTPTGAALLRVLVDEFGSLARHGRSTRWGTARAGERKGSVPNLLRVVKGRRSGIGADRVVALETNLDDLVPEHFEYLMERLLEAGAPGCRATASSDEEEPARFSGQGAGTSSASLGAGADFIRRVDGHRGSLQRVGPAGPRAPRAKCGDSLWTHTRQGDRGRGRRQSGLLPRVRLLQARGS